MKFRLINRNKFAALGLMSIMLVALAQPAYAASAGKITEVAKEFICNCGCNKMLPACDMQCGKDFKKIIGQKIDDGWNKQKISDFMVKNYNEQILAAPTKKGFNLTAWIMPFVVFGGAAVALGMVIMGWVKATGLKEDEAVATARAAEENPAESEKETDKYHEKLNEELKDYDW